MAGPLALGHSRGPARIGADFTLISTRSLGPVTRRAGRLPLLELMGPSDDLRNPVASATFAAMARREASAVLARLDEGSRRGLERAEQQARILDDNHVGTEHMVLGLLADQRGLPARILESLGITRESFLRQLDDEEGHSPAGPIPLSPRASKVIALAGAEADRLGHRAVTTAHLLLGVIDESELWSASGKAGPHHLKRTAEATGHTLTDVRACVLQELGLGNR